jgi:hypothetical protein
MGTKILIKGTEEFIDLPRGSAIPREGETIILIRRGQREEKLYSSYLVEHKFDFNSALPISNTLITVEEINDIGIQAPEVE